MRRHPHLTRYIIISLLPFRVYMSSSVPSINFTSGNPVLYHPGKFHATLTGHSCPVGFRFRTQTWYFEIRLSDNNSWFDRTKFCLTHERFWLIIFLILARLYSYVFDRALLSTNFMLLSIKCLSGRIAEAISWTNLESLHLGTNGSLKQAVAKGHKPFFWEVRWRKYGPGE